MGRQIEMCLCLCVWGGGHAKGERGASTGQAGMHACMRVHAELMPGLQGFVHGYDQNLATPYPGASPDEDRQATRLLILFEPMCSAADAWQRHQREL